jgi:thioredoxin 1
MELNNENFDELINDELVLVDFFATWCGPCRMLSPIIDEVANEENIKVVKVDVDKHEDLAKRFGIMSIPTVIVFKNGVEEHKSIGLVSKEEILTWIK